MNWTEYCKAASRTFPHHDPAVMPYEAWRAIHLLAFACKFNGELWEWSLTNYTDPNEAGDVCWYIAAMQWLLDMPIEPLAWYSDEKGWGPLLTEAMGKYCTHGIDATSMIITEVCGEVLCYISSRVGLERAYTANIEKLQKRYPSGFVLGGGIRT